jgi:type IV secretory pathway VirB6-like protein
MSFSRLTLLLFLTLQVADGAITYGAASIFGTGAEGNPILATWMQIAGIGPTLVAAKLLACGAGLLLYYHYHRGHVVLAALNVCYAFGAVLPWLRALSAI